MKSILIYGSGHICALDHIYIKHLLSVGYSTILFPAQSKFLVYYNKSFVNKLIFRAGFSSIYSLIDTEFRKKVLEFNPDIIWVFKGMELFPETIGWLKDRGIKVANYNPDNPYIFSGRGSGNKNVTKGMRFFDLYMTYDTKVLARLRKNKIKAELIPFGFDIADEALEKAIKAPEIIKACFVGSPDSERAALLNELLGRGISIDIYGDGWGKFRMGPDAQIFPAVYNDEFWITLRKYRVQINMMRKHNINSHNMRSFDIPGVGGIQVAPYTHDHDLFFEDGKEIFLYKNMEHCATLISTLLSLSAEDASFIRKSAREASLLRKYSYKNRCEQVIQLFHNL